MGSAWLIGKTLDFGSRGTWDCSSNPGGGKIFPLLFMSSDLKIAIYLQIKIKRVKKVYLRLNICHQFEEQCNTKIQTIFNSQRASRFLGTTNKLQGAI